jgi:YVTN family beta-propeller protein
VLPEPPEGGTNVHRPPPDFNQPERFDLGYAGSDGRRHRPVMIHRGVLSSMERLVAYLIERYDGAFPPWLAPLQVLVLPVSDQQHGLARVLTERISSAGLRARCDPAGATLGARIRRARERYPVGASPYDITFAGGAAWTTNYGDGTVTRIDAGTGQERTLRVGTSPVGIAHASGAVWVANQGSGTMSRIDTATLKITTIKLGGKPSWTAYAGSTVWVGDQAAGTVVRIDARAGSVAARVKVGSTPNDGDVGDGAVWFPDRNGGLYRIGEKSNAVTGPYPLQAGNPFTLSTYAGRLWIADFAGTDVIVVDPARLPATT